MSNNSIHMPDDGDFVPVLDDTDRRNPFVYDPDDFDPDDLFYAENPPVPTSVSECLRHLDVFSYSNEEYALAWYVDNNREVLAEFAEQDSRVAKALVKAFNRRIAQGDSSYLTHLGGLYYMGCIVEQDYDKARELYEEAAEDGEIQGQINLGYIWEYGRCGERDLHKAYECYALAAMIADAPEAYYKIGDLYNRGLTGEPNKKLAYKFWDISYSLASKDDLIGLKGQAAFRIAKVLLEDEEEELEDLVPLGFLLQLLPEAELGIRKEIAHGGTYYAHRLEQTLAYQDEVRALINTDPQELNVRFMPLK